MCQLLGMNANTPTDVMFSFTGLATRADEHKDGFGIAFFEGRGARVFVDAHDVTEAIRTPAISEGASKVSRHAAVRAALLGLQRGIGADAVARGGCVAEGRDMGTVVFPDAPLKVFLTASAAQRAQRRWTQLEALGIPARIEDLRADLEARDQRDKQRAVAPLKPAEDALSLDNSELNVDQSVDLVLGWWRQRRPFSDG